MSVTATALPVRLQTLFAAILALGLLAATRPAVADRPHDRDRGSDSHHDRGDFYDNRYNHNHYYPARGRVVTVLPERRTVVRYGRDSYYFSRGVWYRPYGPRFIVARPPVGLFISVLPDFYTTVWVGGIPYYYADDVYYRWWPQRRGYIVTAPPREAEVSTTQPATAAGGTDIFIYPKNGQNAEQQAQDRYECHSWAMSQTGFDPTQPSGGVDPSQTAGKRADYLRAMSACLEGRGYTVK